MELGSFDLSDPHTFIAGVPHEYFAWLRSNAPVSWQPNRQGGGFWNVVRYADIVEVETNVDVFTSRTNIKPLPAPDSSIAALVDRLLILSDPPRHAQLRKLIMKGFTPKAISRIEEKIRRLCVTAVDAVAEAGECDLHDVAAYMPIEVVAELLGVPEPDRQQLFNWANAIFGAGDPEISSLAGSEKAAGEMFQYARDLAIKRRKVPGDDVFSQIAVAQENGEMLSDLDLGAFFLIIATAGNETTRTQILQGMLTLMENPDAMAALRRDPSLIPNAVEEMLRITSPALCFGRKATRDYLLQGQQIKAGDQVIMWYCSGSRDETIFTDPDRFDILRPNARDHMAFGSKAGIHRCLGAMLARSELHAIFKEIVTRLPDIELAGPATRLRSNFTNGIKHMPVRYTPATRVYDEPARSYASQASPAYLEH
ncbi:cytochrome P450 [Pseudomonas silvicola]|nr:cytochrome P450 [Pseudomonas silvicola]